MCYNGIMDMTAVVTTSITAFATTILALSNYWLNSQRKKDKQEAKELAERNSAKASIQSMITQDIIRTEILKKMPENKQAILKEYDRYSANGGNSYIKRQVQDYLEWQEHIGLTKN